MLYAGPQVTPLPWGLLLQLRDKISPGVKRRRLESELSKGSLPYWSSGGLDLGSMERGGVLVEAFWEGAVSFRKVSRMAR